MHGTLCAVIPTLEAASDLANTLGALEEGRRTGLLEDIVVADGGSSDGTAAVARQAGARVVTTATSRGGQLAAGAAHARGRWLLFLHADTVLAPGWTAPVRTFVADDQNRHRAATFRFRLNDPKPAARRVEALVAWRCRALGLPYGDQGLLISRSFYEALGGFRALPIMEDVDLVRRIGRRRLVLLNWPAATSAARYRRDGYLVRPLRNLVCLGLYFLGLPSRWLVRIYG
ncbi:MAG: TIGR04283 family arsenosugar biosynthesis glycosyltransferase [Alphaproteobacteria bacterium]|nr:TIGR04283 family arsenosugar biosynthesis glycosyltransferase [Alphaproteobacteria bacterium]